jgi:hypothetical protein
MKKKITKKEQIVADVDDEIYLMMKRMQLKHNLTWAKARDAVNYSIERLYSYKKCEKCGVLLDGKNCGVLGMSPKGIVDGYCVKCLKKMDKKSG